MPSTLEQPVDANRSAIAQSNGGVIERNRPGALRPQTPSRRRFQITREGWAAFALTGWVLASAVMSHVSLILLVFCVLVALLLLGSFQTLRNVRHLEARRRLPDHAFAGRPFHLEFEVRNRRLIEAAHNIVLTSSVQPAPADTPDPGIFFGTVPPRTPVSTRREIVLPHRGLYRFSELELSSRYPLGFAERGVVLGEAQTLLVYPRIGRLSRRFFQVERENHPHEEGSRPGLSMLEADYHGLREYRDGDSPRWIHWPTSARRGSLMVKEFEAMHNRDVAILLDPWVPERAEAADLSMLELAISFTATLCVELCERHSLHVMLGIASEQPVVRHGQSSSRLLRELLEQLAIVKGTPHTRWEELFQELPLAWATSMRITAVSPRTLDLAAQLGAADYRVREKWQRMSRRLVEVNVTSSALRQFFELS